MVRHRQVAHHHAETVVERHRDAQPVGRRASAGYRLADEEAVVEDVAVRQRRALGAGGAGELDVDGVVELQASPVSRPGVGLVPALALAEDQVVEVEHAAGGFVPRRMTISSFGRRWAAAVPAGSG